MERRAAALDRLAASTLRLASVARVLPRVAQGMHAYSAGAAVAARRTDLFGTTLHGAGNVLDRFGTLFSRMIRILAAYAIITTVTNALRDLVSVLVAAPAKMELWGVQLTTLVGNATIAAEKLKLLKDVAIETPLELPDLFSGLTTLQAFRVEISERTLPLLADLAAVSGRTFREIAEVAGKVVAGSPQAITRSLPTLGIAPDDFKARAAEMGSRAEALFTIIEERFKDFALRSAQTTIGLVSNIKDAIFVIASDVGEGILGVLRPEIQATFDALQKLRNDPARLARLQQTMAGITRGLVSFVKRLGDVVDVGRRAVDILGGLRGILTVLAGSVLVKVAAGLVLMLTRLNPVTAGLSLLAAGASAIIGRFANMRAETERTRQSHVDLARAIAETNRQLETNASLVNANALAEQAGKVASLGVNLRMVSTATNAGFLDDPGFRQMLSQADALSGVLTGVGSQQRASQILDQIARSRNRAGQGSRARRADIVREEAVKIRTFMRELGEVFSTEAAHMRERVQFVRDSIEETVDARGLVDDIIPDIDPVELILAKMRAGFLTQEGALSELFTLRDQLRAQIPALLSSGDPIEVELGLKLSARIENIGSVIADLTEKAVNPITEALENAIRQSITRAADALADLLAHIIRPADGAKLADMMKLALAGVLNTVGNVLIQVGVSLKILQDLFRNPLSPAAALAAIAAGVALKALAGSLANTVSDNRAGGGAPVSNRNEPVDFPTHNPSQTVVNHFTVHAVDDNSVRTFFEKNGDELGKAVARVASRDRATGGSAFGAFAPA